MAGIWRDRCAFRDGRGPTVLDRLIGVNAIGSKTTALLILVGLIYGRVDMFVDIALAYALLDAEDPVALGRTVVIARSLRGGRTSASRAPADVRRRGGRPASSSGPSMSW